MSSPCLFHSFVLVIGSLYRRIGCDLLDTTQCHHLEAGRRFRWARKMASGTQRLTLTISTTLANLVDDSQITSNVKNESL